MFQPWPQFLPGGALELEGVTTVSYLGQSLWLTLRRRHDLRRVTPRQAAGSTHGTAKVGASVLSRVRRQTLGVDAAAPMGNH